MEMPLWSSSSDLLAVPNVKRKAVTRHTNHGIFFLTTLNQHAGENIVTFCHHLKTYLFKLIYPHQLLSAPTHLLTTFVLPMTMRMMNPLGIFRHYAWIMRTLVP